MTDLPPADTPYHQDLFRRALLELAYEGDADAVSEVLHWYPLTVKQGIMPAPELQRFVADFIARILDGESSRAILGQYRPGNKPFQNKRQIMELFELCGGNRESSARRSSVEQIVGNLAELGGRSDRQVWRLVSDRRNREKIIRERMERIMERDESAGLRPPETIPDR
jgi:hypothetical protein